MSAGEWRALRLMAITAAAPDPRRPRWEYAAAVAQGGATCVQLRDKHISDVALIGEARRILEALRPFRVPLIINDRLDVALALGGLGLHLGQGDGDPRAAREALGADAIIGLSITNARQIAAAERLPVDYYGVGPIYPTTTKGDAEPPIGLEGLAAIRRLTRRPIVGIGGIGLAHVGAVRSHGADGIAVVSALTLDPDPESAAGALRAALDQSRRTDHP